jgi:hypothetical protein
LFVEKKFEVGGQFKMELEFRTSKPEGILATVSNPGGGNALTLQLHQGQVCIFTLNILHCYKYMIITLTMSQLLLALYICICILP